MKKLSCSFIYRSIKMQIAVAVNSERGRRAPKNEEIHFESEKSSINYNNASSD